MKLTYWVARITTDSSCYNLRAKTKKACQELVDKNHSPEDFEKPEKHTIEYFSAFDLMEFCLSEAKAGE